ncbi:hypothetical protein A3C96_00820 [Candidatus Uhrbacteria bacterium RIFCSPHIGHO2_02_FULL_60_10]|uniref:NlpC/P60 domain-containing protein n=1 Tax=Candidatus Uhrbacteria bacterium RIFCSPHIGHO2_02_FULL_60_10 TaxID=1802392 RepID=A0A1F7U8L0_9BACT|nr:MAG: hypothetical protein A3C96_00820 [Candidatus Uhrbacteria bacterium RIFCSPHIGHO2_02_FULL_60_10]
MRKWRGRLGEEARKQLGKPYKYGAWWQEAPACFDCSSFVQWLYKQIGFQIPRVSIEQADMGRRVNWKKVALLPGDLIFLQGKAGRYNLRYPQGIGHVIIVISSDEVVHAQSRCRKGKEHGEVVLGSLRVMLRRPDITVVKRLLGTKLPPVK